MQSAITQTNIHNAGSTYENSTLSILKKDPQAILKVIEMFADDGLQKELEICKQNLDKAQETIRKQQLTIVAQANDLYDVKRENVEMCKKLADLESRSAVPLDACPLYDIRMYKDKNGINPPPQWVRNLWNKIYVHTMNTTNDGCFYIDNGTAICVVCKILRDSQRITYNFTSSFNDFTACWNQNIADLFKGCERFNRLTCQTNTLKAEYYKPHWRNISIGSLERSDYTDKKHKTIYGNANTIITHLMPDLISIPTV